MRCDFCDDTAELIIHGSDGKDIPICLGHFYSKFRLFELDRGATITIIEKNDVLHKFLSEEVM